MEFYDERPPRHGHRAPAELADDESLSVIHGRSLAMPARPGGQIHHSEIRSVNFQQQDPDE